MPKKNKSRKKKGGKGFFDFLKTGESKSYKNNRCKNYKNEIDKLQTKIEELKSKQDEYKCSLEGTNMIDDSMQQIEPEAEPGYEPEIDEPQQVDVETDSDTEYEPEPKPEPKPEPEPAMQFLYKNYTTVELAIDKVLSPEDR